MNTLTIDGYLPRIVDTMVDRYLGVFGAVVIEGPKWCGKTSTAKNHVVSETSMANPEGDFRERTIAELEPSLAISGERPRLIDEWQDVPKLWDAVRYECDRTASKGLYLLTGSSTPKKRAGEGGSQKQPRHSGAGRIARIRMGTMTLSEQGLSSGKVSLAGLFEGKGYSAVSHLDLRSVAELVVRGGWPAAIGMETKDAALISREYLDAVIEEDIHEVDGVERDRDKVRKLVSSLARNEATLATSKTIMKDMAEQDESITYPTLKEYLDALRRMFFVDDILPWDPALRSPARIRAAAKHHLADPSLAAAALGASPEALMYDPKTLGFLFESLVTHDVLVYAEAVGASVRHYRDETGLEVDLVVTKPDGDWVAMEVKLGMDQVDVAAKSLIAARKKLVTKGERTPKALVVVVGSGGVAHMREDGVQVAPIDTLGI